ncbi:THAP domain-containing protein 3-like [Cydia amplana]|uniref:THAP domain-containing protein 3-like n=1 Tax=Cydia amplana TaxID=1869771 RepID=UPI002FE5369F
MPVCSVVSCRNRSASKNYRDHGVTYHIFPKNPSNKEKWIDATGRGPNWFPSEKSVICSDHFQEKCFQLHNKSRRLFDWAIPMLKTRQVFVSATARV